MKKLIIGPLMLLGAAVIPIGAQALPDTCAGWLKYCQAQCIPAMADPRTPRGCTCEPRYQQCVGSVPHVWKDWRPGRPGFPVKG
jgi:hypothetical protein